MSSSYAPVSTQDLDIAPLAARSNDTIQKTQAQAPHMATTTLRVDGMTCGACTSSVESGFKGIDGIGSISVSLVMGRSVVIHNPAKISAEQVKDIIEDRGFDAEVLSTDLHQANMEDYDEGQDREESSNWSSTTVAVEGMTCGACTAAVEGGFKDVPGVKSFTISLMTERAVVEHDASILSSAQIEEIIEDRGFGAKVLDTQTPTARKKRRRESLSMSKITKTTVSIEGMTCGACTAAVEGGFKDMDAVLQFSISLLAERAVIVHDAGRLPAEKIVEIIEDRGFDAKIITSLVEGPQHHQSSSTVQLKVFGLADNAAALSLESTLLRLPGVSSAAIDFATSRATITHQSTVTGLRALVEAVDNAGYNALVADADDNNAQLESLAKTKEIQEWRRAFRISLSFAIPVFLISMIFPMFIKSLDCSDVVLLIPGLYLGDVVCLALTIPVQFGIGKRFYVSAFKSLKHGSPTMDVLVVLGTSAAFFFSCAAMVVSILTHPHTRPATVFDTSTMLITFITLGRYLENRAKGQTSRALSRLMSLTPSMATIYADPIAAEKSAEGWDDAASPLAEKAKDSVDGPNAIEERTIPTELIQVGDIVIVRPGDKIPADGTVTRGEAYVDESMITGEAMPLLKRKGSILIGGTVNGAGRVDFRVTRAGRDTQLSQIVQLVQEAQTSRAPIQRMADVVAGYFVPIIIGLGVITFIAWMILSHVLPHPPMIFTHPASGGSFMVCLKLCISVIVFACPCALGLSTPTAVMVGTGVGAENGILVKGGAALETATKVTHVVLDKTGTLTMGKMNVSHTDIDEGWTMNETQRRLWWTLIGLAELGSEHPIAQAISSAAKEQLGLGPDDTLAGTVGDFQNTVGRGVSALVEASGTRTRHRVLVGNEAYLQAAGISLNNSIAASSSAASAPPGSTTIYTAIDSYFTGTISLSDTLKPSARACITALHQMGITTSLVTGDQALAAYHIASLVGIPRKNVHAAVSPGEKQSIIQSLQSPSALGTSETVAMVGDGINDSPALASAAVGIAMASGTDVAMEAADIVLMRPEDLLSIPASLHLARTIFDRIKMNLLWACAYNVIGLPFAMGAFLPWGYHLHPMAAGAAMAASSVSVVVSSLLLKFWKRPAWMNVEALEARGDTDVKRREIGVVERWWRSMRRVLARNAMRDQGYVPLETVEPV
ncbi:MAG: hypothetical protein M1824_006633 [Vezdaea acicularis]|nr:MAG: hypothetical protein M1824_006633 [Vezdaea acicularis]